MGCDAQTEPADEVQDLVRFQFRFDAMELLRGEGLPESGSLRQLRQLEKIMMKRITLCLFVLLFAIASQAQTAIPTPDEFLGYPLGERFTPYARILDYFQLLTTRSDLITMQQFGETY